MRLSMILHLSVSVEPRAWGGVRITIVRMSFAKDRRVSCFPKRKEIWDFVLLYGRVHKSVQLVYFQCEFHVHYLGGAIIR